MTRLIFDIETAGFDFDSLDEKSREHLLQSAESEDDEKRIKEGLGFSPLTGQIVAIGILNPDTDKGAVYYISNSSEKSEKDNIQLVPLKSEKDVLKEFWETARYYDQFITFNGRSFDCPFIITRSAILKVKPTKNLMPNRYYDDHIDLLDKFNFFGAVRRKGDLHMWSQAFGIKSPKSDITGYDVTRLFREKKYDDIGRYCGGDLHATKELFEYWNKYMNVK